MSLSTPQAPLKRQDRPQGQDGYYSAIFVGLIFAGIYLVAVVYSLFATSYDTWGGIVVAPFAFFLTIPFLRRMLRTVEPDEWIRRVVMYGFFAKLLSAYLRFATNEFVLGRGDSFVYHRRASEVSREFRALVFGGPAYQSAIPELSGTEFIRLLLSGVYTLSGQTRLGGFVFFSFMSFWGLYLFYRAFSIAMPDGLRRRYAVMVFFMPSMLFWPSSVGKEAWMTTMLGLGAYGLARLLAQRRLAYIPIFAAVAGMGIVRPHVAAIFLCGLVTAFMLRRSGGGGSTMRKIFSLVVLAVAAGLLVAQLESFFNLEDGLNAQEVFDKTQARSSQGGSQFETAQPTGISGLPWAFITVLFRPLLYEAGSVAGLVTSLEGTMLLGLFLWNAPRLARLPALIVTRPYLGFIAAYSMVFIFAFSAVSNFGILARQRTQLLPAVVVTLAIPVDPNRVQRSDIIKGRSRPHGRLPMTFEFDGGVRTEAPVGETVLEKSQPRYIW